MRTLIAVCLVLPVMTGQLTVRAEAQENLTVVSWGGSYQEGLMAASWQPAADALGISLREDTLSGLESVRLQVRGGVSSWDVVDLGGQHCETGAREGLFEPLDYEVIAVNNYPEGSYSDHWVGYSFYSSVIGWNTDRVAGEQPRSWADFWDLEKFPGGRALFRSPDETLEQALLADGVPMEDVYDVLGTEEGLERAIAKLAEIEEHVIWWETGAQAAQLLRDGEVAMGALWSARAKGIIDEGANADFTYEEGVIGLSCWAIPKGSSNKELAMQFIAEASKAEYAKNYPEHLGYGAVNPHAFEGMDQAEIADVNSAPQNLEKQLVMDQDFWAEHSIPYGERFTELLIR